jgi:endo-1,4-beta-xylanase
MAVAAQLACSAESRPFVVKDALPTGDETLRQAAQRRGIKIGAAVSSEQLVRDEALRAAVLRDCALLVPEWELKWASVRKSPVQNDFSGFDMIARFARENGLALRGHPLVWHAAMPDWAVNEIRNGNAGRLLDEHVRLVTGRYAGRVLSWDVVNEAIKPEDGLPGGLRDTPWLRALGDSYVERAFRVAHAADPDARLVYNDYNMEYEPAKAQAIVALIKKLKDNGVPLHAVGLQSHLWTTRRKLNLPGLRDFCRAIVREGVEIIITELDVRENDFDSSSDTRDKRIASVTEAYLDTVFAECVPRELVLWGLSDRYSWLSKPKFNPENPHGFLNRGLPYDTDMRQKALWQVLMDKIRSIPLTGKHT